MAIISFDLDGVVCNVDGAILSLLHRAERDQVTGARERLRNYYLTRRVILHPNEWLTPKDIGLIITGRIPSSWEWTRRWADHHLPGMTIECISTPEVEHLFSVERYDDAVALQADLKYAAIRRLDVDVHIDNNPLIVARLRRGGVRALLHGGAVWQAGD